jgi:colanic acid biosynthesis glycosyl transferase WcaI
MRQKILIVSQHYWPESFRISDIAEGLVERGYQVDVLCGIPNYPSGKFFKDYGYFKNRRQLKDGVRIYRVPEVPRGNSSNTRIFLNYLSFPICALFYIPLFLFRGYDRILAYQTSPVYMSLPAIVIARLTRAPLYFYIGDFWPHCLFSVIEVKSRVVRGLLTRISYWHYRRATGAIAVHKGIGELLVSEVGLKRSQTLYIPQAPEKIYERRERDPELEARFKDRFVVLFAGNISPAQCFDVVTQAARIVKEKGYEDIHYVIVGDGMSRKWLENEVKTLGLEENFHFEGVHPVEDIPKYQTMCDALIVALSKSSVFEYVIPSKVYSYMASGRPIVGAMDGEGQRLINQYSSCGICGDSGDVQALAAAIMRIRDMPTNERTKMGEKGFSYYRKHFDREHNLDRLTEFVFNDNRIIDSEYAD